MPDGNGFPPTISSEATINLLSELMYVAGHRNGRICWCFQDIDHHTKECETIYNAYQECMAALEAEA